ncbi:MAG TPA: hypothetical protein DIT07_02525 [Sphingobacteriaceae bacterium]|nr:hypothetical protein [Sphingobacteriaceae bacterium]
MKKRTILYLMLLLLCKSAFSQYRDVTITYQFNPNGDVVFMANNSDYCDYFITLTFNGLANTTVPPTAQVNARPGLSQVLKLTPVRLNEPIRFGYSYSYIKGNSNPKINAQFKYLLPVKEGKNTKADQIKNLEEFLGNPVSANWYALSFSMDEGDTVYASRGGVVCRINPAGKATGNTGTVYTSSTNSVEIFHDDGTFAKYDLLKNNGILTKSGEKINAGDPIGIIGKVYGQVQLSFIVYYLDKKQISNDVDYLTGGYSFVKPKFALTEKTGSFIEPGETYSALKPVSIITQEMSKKDKEKFLDGGKN